MPERVRLVLLFTLCHARFGEVDEGGQMVIFGGVHRVMGSLVHRVPRSRPGGLLVVGHTCVTGNVRDNSGLVGNFGLKRV